MRQGGHPDWHKPPRRRKPATPRTYHALLCSCDGVLLEAAGVTAPCRQCGQRPATFTATGDVEALRVREELLNPAERLAA